MNVAGTDSSGGTEAGEYTINALGKGSAGSEVLLPLATLAVLEVKEGVMIEPVKDPITEVRSTVAVPVESSTAYKNISESGLETC